MAPPPPIFIILDRDCILERMPLNEPIMLVTSTSVRPAPLAMRRRREAVCRCLTNHAALLINSTAQAEILTAHRPCPLC